MNNKIITLFEEVEEIVGGEVLVVKTTTGIQVSCENRGSLNCLIKKYSMNGSDIDEITMDGNIFYYLNIIPN